ncbi:AzlC family ABC transporter permease [Lachnoclostridium sp. An181]|uniref:AzlC family ABC transporter permease n=1 Tax=Lachnoclostridium sp. An181 TaxID=1965575 RepID=UPI000B38AD09|nr:AzlC family ABC transporter permease [Lachnoclostridium sp. An181]OUP49996.1 branched-chain amino acid ABC transporter permease [Lachnoclostridium sp. An181]
MGGYGKAFRKAFPYTVPVLTGYLFIGIAFGVMYAEKGYSFLWAGLMSLLVYAGSGQYLAVNFFVPGISLFQVIFLTLMVNIRHIFYGISLLEKFNRIGKKRWYMIFGLTDETYSLLCTTKVPKEVDEEKFLFAIALLDQLYWIMGSIIGALAGALIPFNSEGIDFAMTALFLVIFVEQWGNRQNRIPAVIGVVAAVVCLLVFGADSFALPTMLCIVVVLFIGKSRLDKTEIKYESEEEEETCSQ